MTTTTEIREIIDGIEYPTPDLLRFWWSCWRKIPYETREQAEAVNAQFETSTNWAYSCRYGDHWHNGKPITGNGKGKHSPHMMRKQWRKRRLKPTIDELHQGMLAGTGRPQ